jgi:hypothetical protein
MLSAGIDVCLVPIADFESLPADTHAGLAADAVQLCRWRTRVKEVALDRRSKSTKKLWNTTPTGVSTEARAVEMSPD